MEIWGFPWRVMAKKRPRTVWRSRAVYDYGGLIRAGRMFNHPTRLSDVIRLQIKAYDPDASVDICLTVDEALAVSSCLGNALAHEMLPKANKLRKMFR